jgi:hypothetical protein
MRKHHTWILREDSYRSVDESVYFNERIYNSIAQKRGQMKVHHINSRRLFADYGPRAPELVPEGVRFSALLVATLVLPATGLSIAVGSPLVLAGLVAVQALGVLIGRLIYDPSPAAPLSCVPVHENPTIPAQEKKAA